MPAADPESERVVSTETTDPTEADPTEADPTEADPTEATEPAETERVESPVVPPEPLTVRASTLPGVGGFSHSELLEAIRTGRGREFKPVGHSSVVFRVRLDNPHMAAYRPRTRQHRRGHLAEAAAYAIGRLLGLDNVVPATLRTVTRREIADHLHRRHSSGEEWDPIAQRVFYRERFETPGAAIYWVPQLQEAELDQPAERRRWTAILSGNAPIPVERIALMRDLSNMRVFDYLIANWDRFSGGNLKVFTGVLTPRIALRDHNIAFGRLAPERGARLRDAVRQTTVFSRSLVERLARLDETAILTALASLNSEAERERLEGPILTDAQIAAVLERVQVVLSHVGALTEARGDERTLGFE